MLLMPTVFSKVLFLTSLAACAWWWWAALGWAVSARRMPRLADLPAPSDRPLPPLSVIIPARDEAAVLEGSLRSVLGQLPPGGEVLLVDDRSSDGTGEIAQDLAREDHRLKVITIRELPPGWLGKTHALQTGADASAGEWLLFTDADVRFTDQCLPRALGYAVGSRMDHLVVSPEMRTRGFWERVFVGFFLVLFTVWTRAWRVNDPRSGSFMGLGAFNLVKRDAYRLAGQHLALKDEVIDDLFLGRNLRRTGGRQGMAEGKGCLWVRWNVGLSGLLRGVEKNAYAASGYNPMRAAAGCLLLLAATVVPALSPLAAGHLTALLGLGTWASFALMYCLSRRVTDAPWAYFLTFPLGAVLNAWAIVRSAVLYHARGGVAWRGTVYRRGADPF